MTDARTELAHATEEIDASPEEVFDALLDPEALARWFSAPDEGRTRDWHVDAVPGGAWEAHTVAPDGTPGTLAGEIVTIDPPRALELRWHTAPGDAAGSSVRFDLEPVWRGGERITRITVTHVADRPWASRVVMGAGLCRTNHPHSARAAGILGVLRAYLACAVAVAR